MRVQAGSRLLWVVAIAAGAAISVACGDDPTGSVGTSGLFLTPTQAVIAVDSTVHFEVTGILGGDTIGTPEQLEFESSDTVVASVDSTGTVLGLQPGTAIIRATWHEFAADADIHVGVRFTSLSAGGSHTCGLSDAGLAFCWGDNEFGQLGIGRSGGFEARPMRVSIADSVVAIDAGTDHTCALVVDGSAHCWGANPDGRLGFGLTEMADRPMRVAGRLPFDAIEAGDGHTCALTPMRKAYCWGANGEGQLGDGSTRMSPVPVEVAGGLTFRDIAVGGAHSCGVTSEKVYCWGHNDRGQLGIGGIDSHKSTPTPTAVDLVDFESVEAGRAHSCAEPPYTSDAYCWGDNSFGQVGAPLDSTLVAAPWPTDSVFQDTLAYTDDMETFRLGADHGCATAFRLYFVGEDRYRRHCWGRNDSGQLGDGTTQDSHLPVHLPGNWQAYSLGGSHSCGLNDERRAYCWGRGDRGQLGSGDTDDRVAPARVRGQR